MRLDPSYLKFITKEEMRVLMAVEMGMRNHEWVPLILIERISHLKRTSAFTNLKLLLKNKLVAHQNKKYDGYKLTYLGYDYLALYSFMKRGTVSKIIHKIGVGKESDIYTCENADKEVVILKLARLGRTSFRTIKKNRDYITQFNWLYLSRLASVKEYSFMQSLYQNGFPTPKPIDWSRHAIVMSLVDGFPLCQVQALDEPKPVFEELLKLIQKLAEHGLIHSDFNEFNIMICDVIFLNINCFYSIKFHISNEKKITMIDFPQMVSTKHYNAKFYFERDVNCIHTYFEKKFKFTSDFTLDMAEVLKVKVKDLDNEVKASGFVKKGLGEQNVEDLALLDEYEKIKQENSGYHSENSDNQSQNSEHPEEEDLEPLEEEDSEHLKEEQNVKEEFKLENDNNEEFKLDDKELELSDIDQDSENEDSEEDNDENEDSGDQNEEQIQKIPKCDRPPKPEKIKKPKKDKNEDFENTVSKFAEKQMKKKNYRKYKMRTKQKNHENTIKYSEFD